MELSNEDLEELASVIVEKIKEEFAIKKMSGNLVRTIQVVASEDKVEIIIPANTYSMLQYQTRGVIVPTWHGSYASKLDLEGSEFFIYPYGTRKGSFKVYPRNHIGFVDKVINEGVNEWLARKGKYTKGKVTELEGNNNG